MFSILERISGKCTVFGTQYTLLCLVGEKISGTRRCEDQIRMALGNHEVYEPVLCVFGEPLRGDPALQVKSSY